MTGKVGSLDEEHGLEKEIRLCVIVIGQRDESCL